MDVKMHLESYGIRHFVDDSYWEWGGQMLGSTRASELDKLRQPLVEGRESESQRRRFYDYIAHPLVASVVHSSKADAIRVSGEFVGRALPREGRILDLGCGIGYLTTYYAAIAPAARVVGCDWSKESIKTAQNEAVRRGLQNVTFRRADWAEGLGDELFDCVCSTQAIVYATDEQRALARLASLLVDGGRFVCVEPFAAHEQAEMFVEACARHGLGLEAFEFVFYSDLGDRGAFPGMILGKGKAAVAVDLASEYDKARTVLEGR